MKRNEKIKERSPIIKFMQVTTAIGCLVRCRYCPQNLLIKKYKEGKLKPTKLSLKTFKLCLQKIPKDVEIVFGGLNEPWQNPECSKMLAYAHKKGYRIRVFTTLVGMKQNNIELLKTVPFDYDKYGFVVHLPSAESLENIKVDNNYLSLLSKIDQEGIATFYHFHGENLHPAIKKLFQEKKIQNMPVNDRAGNIPKKIIPGMIKPKRKRGALMCEKNLRKNVLLPGGDILICDHDYGMKHVIGNLISQDYHSLFNSQEFQRIEKGLTDESEDILCRYCLRAANK